MDGKLNGTSHRYIIFKDKVHNNDRKHYRDFQHRGKQIIYQICPNFNQSITTKTISNHYNYIHNNNLSFYKCHNQLNNCSSKSKVNQGYHYQEYNYNSDS